MPAIKSLEPSEIFADIETHPPLMREQAKATYLGLDVDWTLTLANGWEDKPGFARLALRQRRNDVRYVAATVPLAECPWLKHWRAGEILRVRGRIAELSQLTITLRGASVSQVVAEAVR